MGKCSAQQAAHLANLKSQYQLFVDGIEKISKKGVKEYTIGDRTFEYQNIKEMYSIMNDINKQICQLEVGRGARTQSVIPI